MRFLTKIIIGLLVICAFAFATFFFFDSAVNFLEAMKNDFLEAMKNA